METAEHRIREFKDVESLLRMQRAVLEALWPGTAPRAGIQRLLQMVRDELGVDLAFVSEFVDGKQVYRTVSGEAESFGFRIGDDIVLEQTFCQRVLDGRLPPVVPDAAIEPAVRDLEVTRQAGIGSYIAAPITLSDGSLYGTLCGVSHAPDYSLKSRDATYLRVIARFVSERLDEQLQHESGISDTRARVQGVLNGRGLSMAFQPIVELKGGRIAGFEALARFGETPRHSPEKWFADAEAVGLRQELELHAVRTALADLPRLHAGEYVSVNVSPDVATMQELVDTVLQAGAPRVVLEITEHAPIADYEGLIEQLRRMREAGARLAIDDVGSGFASMLHVLTLQPDLIKLDRTLIQEIHLDPLRQAMAESMQSFAAKTGGAVVAEGVETQEEFEALRALGIRYAQGYFLGRPAVAPALLSSAVA
jgi:EAL domain-containing protein (putative c-di-GMP-specific phosphodiesterase class I)